MTSATGPAIVEVPVNGITLRVREWGAVGKPRVVLIPGTGLAAALFANVERLLARDWHGISLERRGQGLSDKPKEGYDFHHFADDLQAVMESLDIRETVGVGHSAGGTDLLVAAGTSPARWRRIVVIEPTVQDPRRPVLSDDGLRGREVYERTLRRRTSYPSLEAALERFREAPVYSLAREEDLRAYLEEALALEADGSVSLRCPPAVEAQMNRYIVQAMDHCYRAPEGLPDPFDALRAIRLPSTVVSTGQSGEIYQQMAALAAELLPNAMSLHYEDAGHLLPLDHPAIVAALVQESRSPGC